MLLPFVELIYFWVFHFCYSTHFLKISHNGGIPPENLSIWRGSCFSETIVHRYVKHTSQIYYIYWYCCGSF